MSLHVSNDTSTSLCTSLKSVFFSGEKAKPCSYHHHCVQLSFVFLYARMCQSLKLDGLFASPTVPVVPFVLQIDTSIESVTTWVASSISSLLLVH